VPAAVSSGKAALVGSLPTSQEMNVTLVLPLRNQDALTSLLDELYDPSNPKYRQFLTVAQFTEQFGPAVDDYQKVVQFAQGNGLAVTDTPPNRLIVPVRGTVAQIQSAFNVQMNVYRHPTENRTFYSPDREPSPALTVPLRHIAGLDNFQIPRHSLTKRAAEQVVPGVVGSGPGGTSYTGSDIRAAYYGGSALAGSGQVVGLLELGEYNIADVNASFANVGQAYSVPINNVLLDGTPPSPGGSDDEQVIDIVAAIGMAPALSQVRVYIGSIAVDIYNKMASENIAKQISVSWFTGNQSADEQVLEQLAAQGQTVFAASGDSYSYTGSSDTSAYPAEDPYVTGVGGTSLTTNGVGGPWLSETSWDPSGGGISLDGIGIPSWQAGVANALNGASTTLRNIPDVAALADPSLYICESGECSAWGGTSLAAPLWAGFMALVNQQAVEAGSAPAGGVGFINKTLYTIGKGANYGSDFHDIVSGSNGGFNAVKGYDLVTGWGSPNGQNLINALAGTATSGFTLRNSAILSGMDIKPGATGTTTITVNDLSGFNGRVAFAVSGLPTGVTASFGANPTTTSSVLTLTVPASTPFSTSNVTVTGTSGSRTATTSFSLTVEAPHFTLSVSPYSTGLYAGSTTTATVSVNALNGFTGRVNLVASNIPAGVTTTFGTNPTTGTSVLTLTASSSAPITSGLPYVTITGTSGALSSVAYLYVGVLVPFTIATENQEVSVPQGGSASGTVEVTGNAGFNGNVNLSNGTPPPGITAVFNPNPVTGTGNSQLTFTASNTAALGISPVVVTGTWGSYSAQPLTFFVTVVPSQGPPQCAITYTISPQSSSAFGAAITIDNEGPTLTNWTLAWSFANGQKITSLWNGIESQSGANVTVTNESYNGTIQGGTSYTGLGFNGTWNGVTNAIPTSFTINGTACTSN
jgi:subtilase family serine protease